MRDENVAKKRSNIYQIRRRAAEKGKCKHANTHRNELKTAKEPKYGFISINSTPHANGGNDSYDDIRDSLNTCNWNQNASEIKVNRHRFQQQPEGLIQDRMRQTRQKEPLG